MDTNSPLLIHVCLAFLALVFGLVALLVLMVGWTERTGESMKNKPYDPGNDLRYCPECYNWCPRDKFTGHQCNECAEGHDTYEFDTGDK